MTLTIVSVLSIFTYRVHSQNIASISHTEDIRHELTNEKLSEAIRLFTGLEGLKNYFRNNTDPLAHRILETFENECFYMNEPELPPQHLRKPFIVIEGNQKNSREVVGVRLAGMLNGRFLVHPAPCLIKFVDSVPKGTLIRRAFYALSLYATSFNVKVHLSLDRAVVLNGYWLDQLSFSLVQTFKSGGLPPATSDVFKCPEGLMMPDILFYLNLPDDLFFIQATTRSPQSWKKRVLALYKGLESRHPVVVQDLKGVFRVTTDSLYEHIVNRLSNRRDVIFRKHNVNFDYDHYKKT